MNRRIHIDMQVQLPRDRGEHRMSQASEISSQQVETQGHRAPSSMTTNNPITILGSQEIFNGSREVAIDHDGSLYRLKITRQGKLILNK